MLSLKHGESLDSLFQDVPETDPVRIPKDFGDAGERSVYASQAKTLKKLDPENPTNG